MDCSASGLSRVYGAGGGVRGVLGWNERARISIYLFALESPAGEPGGGKKRWRIGGPGRNTRPLGQPSKAFSKLRILQLGLAENWRNAA